MVYILKKQVLVFGFILLGIPCFAQWVNPVTNPAPGSTVTYYFDNGVNYIGAKWTATNGIVDTNSLQQNGTTYSVSVQWTIAGAGLLNFQMRNTVISTLNVNICGLTTFNTSGGGSVCPGGTGVTITLSGSQAGVNYQKYVSGVPRGTAIAGTGGPLNITDQTSSGNYSFAATEPSTGCTLEMNSFATVTYSSNPTRFSISGGGVYCSGGSGLAISLDGSESGVNYQLQVGGGNIGLPLAGNGSGLAWGSQTTAGNYTIVATNATTSCLQNMTGSVAITTNPLPIQYTVGGGGSYCSGGNGLNITLSGSQTGVNYQLQLGGNNIASLVAGTGSELTWGNQINGGNYSVTATTSAGCNQAMSGNVSIGVGSLPGAYTVAGGGTYCSSGSEVSVTLDGSRSNTTYQLQVNGNNVGGALTGTGGGLVWSNLTLPGTYTVLATYTANGCTRRMDSEAYLVAGELPTQYTVSGGGSFCSGGLGRGIRIAGFSQANVNYTLYKDGVSLGWVYYGSDTAPQNVGWSDLTQAGTYTILGTLNTSGCSQFMSGSATIVENPTPAAPTLSNTIVCGSGSITGSLPANANTLRWYSSPTGGTFTASATSPTVTGTTAFYTSSYNTTTTCESAGRTPVTLTVNPLPVDGEITANVSSICLGGTITISSMGGVGTPYYWASSDGGQSWNVFAMQYGAQASFQFTPTAAGTYRFHLRHQTACGFCWDVGGCTTNPYVDVTVNPIPNSPSFSTPLSVCANTVGATYSITNPVVNSTYTWSIDGGIQTGGGNTSAITVSWGSASLGAISVYETNASGCQGTSITRQVTIKSLPTFASSLGGMTSICEGANGSTYTIEPISGSTFSWSVVGGIIASGGSTNTITVNWGVVKAGNSVSVRETNSSGCIGDAMVTPITMSSIPTMPTGAATPAAVCGSGSVTLSSSPVSGSNSQWYISPSGGAAFSTAASVAQTVTATTAFYVSAKNTYCESARSRVDVTVNPLPLAPSFSAPGNPGGGGPPGGGNPGGGGPPGSSDTFCQSGTLMAFPGANGTSINWYASATGGSPLPNAVSATTSPITYATTTYYITTASAFCESTTPRISKTITINPIPAMPSVTSGAVCGAGTLSAVPITAGSSVKWYASPTGGTPLLTSNISPQVSTTTTFYVSGAYGSCESTRMPVTLSISSIPTIAVTGGTQLSYGSITSLSAPAAYAYRWLLNGQDKSTQQSFIADQVGTYTVSVRQEATSLECTSASVQISNFLSAQAAPINYVSTTRLLKKGVTETTSLYTLAQAEVNQTITYQDGLGRTFQSVGVGLSPQQTDLVSPVGYGKQGLVDSTFLPYATASRQGSYRPNAIRVSNNYIGSEQQQFYQNTAKVASDAKPFARAVHRAAPDARITEQGAAGAAWQPGTGHTVTATQALNNASFPVRLWKFDGTTVGNCPTNTVLVSLTTDENGNQVRTYTNKQGQTVLKQVQLDETISGTLVNWLETYYIYDQYGRLAYQVPPNAMKTLGTGASLNANNASELIYKYTYDTRGRLTQQKVPGAAVKYFVYDKLNRLVLSQDGNQRALNAWAFIKYDVYQRPVYSGLYTNSTQTTLAAVQTLFNNITYTTANAYETPQANAAFMGYSNSVFPTTGTALLSVNYYDGYDFDQNGADDYSYDNTHLASLPTTSSSGYAVRNLPTGSKKLVMGTATWLTSAVFYDDYDRPIQTLGNNHLNATLADKTSVLYDFVGRAIKTKTTHTGATTVNVTQRYTYDHAGRTLGIYHTIDNNTEQQLASYEYNALGQVVDKKLHVTGGTALQSVDMRYSIRGWLKSINNAQLTVDNSNDETNDYFGIELLYEASDTGLGNTALYNGNVAAAKWKGPGLGTGPEDQRSYKYTYDKSDKLKAANFKAHTGSAWAKEAGTLDEAMAYDRNGNLLTLARKQNQRGLSGILVTSAAQAVDNLTYTYTANTNRLLKVEDAVATSIGTGDFKNNVTAATEYTYNTDGSLVGDLNKGVDSMKYNILGKPYRVKFTDGRVVTYKYDASGTKLGMATTVGGTTTVTDYVGGFVYTNNALSFFSSPEGRVVKNASGYEYQYAIADHQGNTRVVFSSAPATATPMTATFEGDANDKANLFTNVSNVVTSVAANKTAGGSKVVRMNQTYAVGPSKSMKVFTGDKIDLEVYAYYEQTSGWGSSNAPLTTLVTAIAGAFGGAPTGPPDAVNIYGGVNSALGAYGLGANAGDGAPAAFLNYILFDKNYKVMNMGWSAVPTTANFAKQKVSIPTINVAEAGYLFTYLSYENQSTNFVYFDDYKVTYTPTNIVQYNEYYPYGLQTATSWTRDNATQNNFLGNGGTELNTTSGLYDLEFRNYDPALARMNQVDPMADKYASFTPYNYSFNAPSNFNDVNGADPSPGEPDHVTRRGYQVLMANFDTAFPSGGGSGTLFDNIWGAGGFNNIGGIANGNQQLQDFYGMSTDQYVGKYGQTYTRGNSGGSGFWISNPTSWMSVNNAGEYQINGYRDVYFAAQTEPARIYGGDGSGSFMDYTYRAADFLNQFNPIALGWDALTGYINGTDRFGNKQSTTETTIKTVSVIPIGKMMSMAASTFKIAAKQITKILSPAELLRIENAATRIGLPITVVGSRATLGRVSNGINTLTGKLADWDYVIPGLNSRNWSTIKNSLPGARSLSDGLPRNIDIIKGPVDTSLPHITIYPR